MADSTPPAACGFVVDYRSLSELQSDHDTYLAHGGLLVPWTNELPPDNTQAVVRISTPLDQDFDLPGRVVQQVPGQGFMVAFESDAEEAKAGLTKLLASDAFYEAKGKESDASASKAVSTFTPEIQRADGPKRKPKYLQLKLADPNQPPPLTADDASEAKDDSGFSEERTPVDSSPPAAVAKPPGEFKVATAGGVVPDDLEYRVPEHGEMYGVFVIKFASLTDYDEVAKVFLTSQLITIPYQFEEEAISTASAARRNVSRKKNDPARLRFQLPGKNVFDLWTVVAAATPDHLTFYADDDDPKFQEAVSFCGTFAGRKRLANEKDSDRGSLEVYMFAEERNVEEEEKDNLPIRMRINRMSMEEKINLAQSGGREARMALAQDSNKAIPMYLLKNARIGVDEIAFIARLANMNPDVLKRIAENPQYLQNSQVVRNLIYNPKTPLDISIRLLDRLPRSELMNFAKRTTGNLRLVMKAKKKLERNSKRR